VGVSNLPDRDWSVAPGELLAELLEERGISQSELARRMGRPTKTINEIINGKAAITPQTAIQLERVLGTNAGFWVNAEAAYRHDLARFAEADALAKWSDWLARFPVKEMVRERILDAGPAERQIDQLLRFFKVASPDAWETSWGGARGQYRQASGTYSREARAAWLRWGEEVAGRMEVGGYDPEKARRALTKVGPLSVRTPAQAAVDELTELLHEVGICFVLLPELPGTRLSGVARWPSPERPLVQLSARHRADDHFWFTVMHELGHVVDSPRHDFSDTEREDGRGVESSSEVVDVEAEQRADAIAREHLVPTTLLRAFLGHSRPDDRDAVRRFARELGVAPGIVVGRLQRDGLLDWADLNDLKRSYSLG
jgi:addiction module HigA family antidote